MRAFGQRVEPGLGRGDARLAPRDPRCERLRIEHELVAADDAALPRPGDGPCKRHVRGPERVVVEQEHRHDIRVRFTRKLRIRIFGGDRAEVTADRDELVVPGDAARAIGRMARAPELVIAGRPDDLAEPWRQLAQGEHEMLGRFADVARDDQPVVREVAELEERFPVRAMAEVQVADGESRMRALSLREVEGNGTAIAGGVGVDAAATASTCSVVGLTT